MEPETIPWAVTEFKRLLAYHSEQSFGSKHATIIECKIISIIRIHKRRNLLIELLLE
jgi:hypothetical protein